jgi:beta-phosphoglucomutase
MQPLAAIIFDMDGVIIHSSPLHERAYREVLHDLPIVSFHYPAVAGMRTDQALRRILAENGVPFTETELAARSEAKSRRARQLLADENPIDSQCHEVLTKLAARHKLALASSASRQTVEQFLDRNHLHDSFVSVLSGADVAFAKPAPEIYELSCARLGCPPSHCLVIEDAVSGVLAGKAAGTTVWAITTTCGAKELKEAGADAIISRLDDLLVLAS